MLVSLTRQDAHTRFLWFFYLAAILLHGAFVPICTASSDFAQENEQKGEVVQQESRNASPGGAPELDSSASEAEELDASADNEVGEKGATEGDTTGNSSESEESVSNGFDGALEGLRDIDQEMELSQNASRIFSNFIVLMQNSWDDVAFSVWDLIKSVTFNTVLYTFLGFVLSIFSLFVVRYLGWTKYDWKHYWAVSWILPLLFLASITIGFCYAGFFRGASNYCERMIKEEFIIERATMTMYCTVIMDAADYEATGQESVSELLEVVDSAEEYHVEFDENLKEKLQDQIGLEEHGWFENFVIENTVYLIDGRLEKLSEEAGIDLEVLILAFMNREEAEEQFGKEQVKEVIAIASPIFETTRKYASAYVTAPFEIQYYLGIVLGLLVPFGTVVGINATILLVRYFTKDDNPPEKPFVDASDEESSALPPRVDGSESHP
ncbi:MAG: hypothetical protein AAF483_20080 [Planctomycetota bacterium]